MENTTPDAARTSHHVKELCGKLEECHLEFNLIERLLHNIATMTGDGVWWGVNRVSGVDVGVRFLQGKLDTATEHREELKHFFTAGYLELCRAANHVAPAIYLSYEGASYQAARAQFCEALCQRLFLIYHHCEDDPKRIEYVEKWIADVGEESALGANLIEMELVQAMLSAHQLPPIQHHELNQEAVNIIESTSRSIRVCQCGGKLLVDTSRRRKEGRIRYLKCNRCGITAKESSRTK
jgi:hypothetical protein